VPYDPDNIFAKILREEIPSERVYEDAETLVFMDIMPRADGHVLVIPKTPSRNLLDASPEQIAACMATVQGMSHAVMQAFAAQGVTVQQFNEAAGGQEVFHLHFHVLPRHDGVRMRPPGTMADFAVLKEHADRIRAVLANRAAIGSGRD
jgi:histidine triad (HIT) family protein